LIEKYGGTHHGYFTPDEAPPAASFSFEGIGEDGPRNIAIALFSFPTIEAYEKYRREVSDDPECQAEMKHFHETKCFTKYERTFLQAGRARLSDDTEQNRDVARLKTSAMKTVFVQILLTLLLTGCRSQSREIDHLIPNPTEPPFKLLRLPVGKHPIMPLIVDVDRDATLDLVIANSESSNVTVYLGDGKGAFKRPRALLLPPARNAQTSRPGISMVTAILIWSLPITASRR
jgi:hypothetical protein